MFKSAEKTGTNEYTVELSFGAEEFAAACVKAYNKNKGKINVPGFRKGKAPKAMIEKMYGENVFYDDALDMLFSDAYPEAIEKGELHPVDSPFGFDIKSIGKEGAELSFKVTVRPVITIEGYKGLEAGKAKAEVTDADVDADINRQRENAARSVEVEGRAVENGDIAVIDFEGFVDGVAFEGGKGEDHELEIGSGSFISGFEEQIIGHNAGDEFDIDVTFPEDYAEELAGKNAVFKIKVKSIMKKELPELDDEFAKDVSEFDTLDELKADIKKNLTEKKENEAQRNFENAVYDALADLVKDEIPEAMIKTAQDNMLGEFKYQVESQGLPFEQYIKYFGMTEESILDLYKERAEKEVKIELALEKIAELEGIEVSDDEIEEEYKTMAEKYGAEIDVVKKAVTADTVKKELTSRKASQIVIESAVATEIFEDEKAETEDAE